MAWCLLPPPPIELPHIFTVEVAEAHEPPPVVWTPERIEEEANMVREKYGLSRRFVETMRCESENFRDPAIQSGHYHNGVRENSWGVAQFWLDAPMEKQDGTLITKEDAINPAIALDIAGWHFSEGRQYKWTCYKLTS